MDCFGTNSVEGVNEVVYRHTERRAGTSAILDRKWMTLPAARETNTSSNPTRTAVMISAPPGERFPTPKDCAQDQHALLAPWKKGPISHCSLETQNHGTPVSRL